ncbi:MAG: 2-oxoglutarate dehydrogenase E1 component [Bacteroidota bacterium]
MTSEQEFHGPNLGYVLQLYDQYQRDPDSVDPATRKLFEEWKPGAPPQAPPSGAEARLLIDAVTLAQAIRTRGYLAADLDPLGTPPGGDPELTLEAHRLSEQDLLSLPASLLNTQGERAAGTAQDAIAALRSIYCGRIGYDYEHVRIPAERNWLYGAAESGRFRPPAQPFDEGKLLERLTQVEAFELFLHRVYPGKTRFSIEGLDIMIPMLDEMVHDASDAGICAILIGMAHRGRLNVLAHILQKPYEQILAEFKDPQGRATTWDEVGWTGDVKYHMGASRAADPDDQACLLIRMPANPSHLEAIDPVIEGMARAANSGVDQPGPPRYFRNASLPILIHGDASFPGQGIVAETLNFSRLPGYTTSGSLHIIGNNQLGFTATEGESRSTLHASDLAEGFEIPVIHVNADDPQACLEAARTSFAYRQEFHKDFVINLIGYRRYGHNEGDEPRFTQPLLYRKIDQHPSLRQILAARLAEQGAVEKDRAEELLQSQMRTLQQVNESLDAEAALEEPVPAPPPHGAAQKVKTSVPLKQLKDLNRALLEFPEEFHLNPKLEKAVERRRRLLDKPREGKIDWAAAEELAFAAILADGIAIRLTGEDTQRGTFSQRHAVFHDVEAEKTHIPLQRLPQARASFEVLNSPLSEAGAIGFEVGYNVQAPERLVIWEAQYGDFINNAQTMLDEFLFSGRAKWGLTPSLVLLLPHGNEGMGPDHSSARIERFLGLAAEINMRIAYPSTAAQYFHLLRRQALLLKTDPLPLVVFTPKGLLRHPLVSSLAAQLSAGGWQPVLDDEQLAGERNAVRSLMLCSGRIYVDLAGSELRGQNADDAIARLEQIYPFPLDAVQALLASYPALERLIWVQEEPLNMGAWNYMRPRLKQVCGDRLALHYVGRPESSSPAEGSSTLYRLNQKMLVEQAFELERQLQTPSVVKEKG